MSTPPEPASFETDLPDVYRFALCMTGDTAAALGVVRQTVEHAVREGIGELRDQLRVKRWLFTEARHLCPKGSATPIPPNGDRAEPEVAAISARFSLLPEAEREAIVLFYLLLFGSADLADVLEIPLPQLGPLLSSAREKLAHIRHPD